MHYPAVFDWRPEFDKFFARNHIYLAPPFLVKGVFGQQDRLKFGAPVFVEPYATMPKKRFMSMGFFSYSMSGLPSTTKIGRYCSISGGVHIMGANHPMDRVTTSPVTYGAHFVAKTRHDFDPTFRKVKFRGKPDPVIVGNDVWIGGDVTIKGGVSIGHGAVVAAGSVVTKDVLPYMIVGGVPAKIIRMRFDEKIVERMLRVEWWRYSFAALPKHWNDLPRFLDDLEDKIETGKITVYEPGWIDVGIAICAISNGDEPAKNSQLLRKRSSALMRAGLDRLASHEHPL